jgi:acyl-CoA reductase-like NAD-dependent aldehyde dehydrogenase
VRARRAARTDAREIAEEVEALTLAQQLEEDRTIEAPMLIGGAETEAASGEVLPVLNPATGARIATVPAGGAEDVDRAARAARDAFENGPWPRLSIHDRARVLNRFADRLEERLEDLFRLETVNNGRPVIETRAQLGRLPEWYRYNAALLLAQRTDVVPMKGPYLNYLERFPLGVCGILPPFNHPLMILSKSLAPALATGNCVVIKPSELTPLTTLELARIASEAGIPDGVINVVTGLGAEAGAPLAAHELIAKITFTGGTEVGREVAATAARRLARSTTELGGKAPVIVFADAGLERAVAGASFAAFIAAGQTCICGSRILVEHSIYDEFLVAFRERAEAIRVGDPADESTQLGPVISARQQERVLSYAELGVSEGARLLTGGGRPTLGAPLDEGFFVEPGILADVGNEARAAQEEIFGPLAVVAPFADEEDAIAKANGVRFGLGSAIWTRDVARAHRVASRMEAGMVWVNDHHRLDPASPWGGVKDSGIGREGGWESFHDFTHIRSVTVRTAADDVDWYAEGAPKRLN